MLRISGVSRNTRPSDAGEAEPDQRFPLGMVPPDRASGLEDHDKIVRRRCSVTFDLGSKATMADGDPTQERFDRGLTRFVQGRLPNARERGW
jgi:hypothetical protein